MWSIYKQSDILEWHKEYPDSIIISPNKIENIQCNVENFKCIPKFPFGASLMGLQRAIMILCNKFNPKHIKAEGFDFQLGPNAYKKWYPSLFKSEGFSNQRQMILFATMKHDFILNYLFLKKFQ